MGKGKAVDGAETMPGAGVGSASIRLGGCNDLASGFPGNQQ